MILIARSVAGDALGFATISFAPFAWTGSDIAFLQDLFVSEAARGLGAGAALLNAVYAEADERRAAQVYWMVDETDETLQRFYERNGIRTPYLRYMRTPWPW
ncbi:GNAT family N-acetyltransferase [Nordella sp. HKS 07]|uniref:GNAT family N-acetyltransferase n=1 Tax=Nordella sp. HKS 07 TaxID=2712222 RepID=UPI0013E20278|nr:GNAT family N-acetyltransferase [Nordella sp. HKS 07]QIG51278.1 GNAT family N-acetyltransferase [Nordella sp. HKS 07]